MIKLAADPLNTALAEQAALDCRKIAATVDGLPWSGNPDLLRQQRLAAQGELIRLADGLRALSEEVQRRLKRATAQQTTVLADVLVLTGRCFDSLMITGATKVGDFWTNGDAAVLSKICSAASFQFVASPSAAVAALTATRTKPSTLLPMVSHSLTSYTAWFQLLRNMDREALLPLAFPPGRLHSWLRMLMKLLKACGPDSGAEGLHAMLGRVRCNY